MIDTTKNIQLFLGDCLEVMKEIPDKSIDMILCDLPYGTTACKWDTIIPFEPLWELYKRIIKDNGAIALTASQPFTSKLVMSNIKMFKYEWIWDKINGGNPFLVKKRPIISTESILIFYNKKSKYYPQLDISNLKALSKQKPIPKDEKSEHFGNYRWNNKRNIGYPKNIIRIADAPRNKKHPTQKPVALMEYLIKTYTDEGDLVLDNCMGSGTTGVACKNLNRRFIGIEKEEKYMKIAQERIKNTIKKSGDING
ncbi:MAG: site-specific DNA-methyltransferase [Patescibacteria group bacterium]